MTAGRPLRWALSTVCVVCRLRPVVGFLNPNLSSVGITSKGTFVSDRDASHGLLKPTHMDRASALQMARQTIRAEDVLRAPQWPAEWPFKPDDFKRMDESVDTEFYDQPRLVYHIDDGAVAALTNYYKGAFAEGADVLDICSSWVSHFPEWKHGNRVALGMNEYELKQNKQVDSYKVKDLNVDASLPFDDDSFDIVTCVVSVDYLNRPLEIFREIARVLRPGGKAIMSMSNRCFPSKAIQIWLQTNDMEHVFIVGSYFHYSGGFRPPTAHDISPNPGRSDPMYIVEAVVNK